jgi:hypothetical protein
MIEGRGMKEGKGWARHIVLVVSPSRGGVLIAQGRPHRVGASSSHGVFSLRGGCPRVGGVLVAWGRSHHAGAFSSRGGVLIAQGCFLSHGGVSWCAVVFLLRGGDVAGFGVTRWHLVKQGGRDNGGTGPLVGWAREEMGSRGHTMTTTTIIRRRPSSLVAVRMPRHRPTVIASPPSLPTIVVRRRRGTSGAYR